MTIRVAKAHSRSTSVSSTRYEGHRIAVGILDRGLREWDGSVHRICLSHLSTPFLRAETYVRSVVRQAKERTRVVMRH